MYKNKNFRNRHEEWLNLFLANCQSNNCSENTIKNYSADLSKYFSWFEYFQYGDISQATGETISDYLEYLSGSNKSFFASSTKLKFWQKCWSFFRFKLRAETNVGFSLQTSLAKGSIKRHLSTLKNFYEFLQQYFQDKNNVFKHNPIKSKIHHIRLKEVDVEKTQLLTAKDFEALDQYIYRPSERFILHFLYYSGLRLHELLALKVQQFDRQQMTIKVARKGGKLHLFRPQMATHLFRLLDVHLSKRQIQSDYLFTNKKGRPLSLRAFINKISSMYRRAGLSERQLTPHSFRKACATNLYIKSKDLLYVRDYLNHQDAAVTQTYIDKMALDQARKSIHLSQILD